MGWTVDDDGGGRCDVFRCRCFLAKHL